MSKLRIFLVAISAMIASGTWACGPVESYESSHLFVMRMPIREAIDKNNLARQNSDAETLDFWYSYTKGAISKDKLSTAISELEYDTFLKNALKSNALTVYLQRHKDNTALKYLRYNSEIIYGSDGNEWSYHEPYTAVQWKALLTRINQLTAQGKLAERIQFLKLRCLFKLNRYNDCITMWKTKFSKTTNKALRDRVKGYVGGAYFWTNRFNEAVDIFQQQGDLQSINCAVNKMLSTTSKEALYAHDPNSIALEYAMQDYANYYYNCMSSLREGESFASMDEGSVYSCVVRDYEATIAFAKKVLEGGKTKNTMFWAGFIGFMKWVHGDADEAYKYLAKAQGLAGTKDMAYCVRLYKLLAGINMKNKPSNFDDYFLTEYRFFLDECKGVQKAMTNYDENNPVEFSAQQLVAQAAFTEAVTPEAIQYYAPKGGLMLTLLQGISDRYGEYGDDGMGCTYIGTLNHDNSVGQDIEILKEYQAGGNGKVEKALLSMGGKKVISEDLLNDIIGTKMLRELRFDEAQQYLSQVPLSYLNSQGIAPYLAHRSMPQTVFKRMNTESYWDDSIKINNNIKLQFAHDMAAKQKNIDILTGDAKAKAQYDFANSLFQASSLGDLWALTDYSWTADDYTSELIPRMVSVLQDAEKNAVSTDVKKKIWFAEITIPSGENGIFLDWNDKTNKNFWNFSNMTTWQHDALAHLASVVTTDDPMYRSCDILRSYIRNYTR